MKKLYLDCETTGLDPKQNGLIQLACIVEIDGAEKEAFVQTCHPFLRDTIDDGALACNGLMKEQISKFLDPSTAKNLFVRFLESHVSKFDKSDKFHLIAYNARFDYDFLRAWFEKCNDKYFGSWFFFPPLDVMNLAAWLLVDKRSELPNFKLGTVAKFLGIEVDTEKQHDALYDVRLMMQALAALEKKRDDLVLRTVDLLLKKMMEGKEMTAEEYFAFEQKTLKEKL